MAIPEKELFLAPTHSSTSDSQKRPVQPARQEQTSGAMQIPPFSQVRLQIAAFKNK